MSSVAQHLMILCKMTFECAEDFVDSLKVGVTLSTVADLHLKVGSSEQHSVLVREYEDL